MNKNYTYYIHGIYKLKKKKLIKSIIETRGYRVALLVQVKLNP